MDVPWTPDMRNKIIIMINTKGSFKNILEIIYIIIIIIILSSS